MRSIRPCPRDKKVLASATIGEAHVDVCGACGGTYFDSEDLFAAAGIAADPSTWDRAETGGSVKPSTLACPGCAHTMNAQDVTHDGKHVEIDRCGKCRGIWLDKGELDTLVAIGDALRPVVEAARKKAQEELAALEQSGEGDFRRLSAADRKRRLVLALAALLAIGVVSTVVYFATRPEPRPRIEGGTGTRAKGEEGCPCGCDRSKAMAAELRTKDDRSALARIDETLATIALRENAGYVTERMVQHRLRMLDVAREIESRSLVPATERPAPAVASRCTTPKAEGHGLRICPSLALHGERIEIVKGEEKLIESSYRLWLEIENLGDAARAIAPPVLPSTNAGLPVARWTRTGPAGSPCDCRPPAPETVRVNVIGTIPGHVAPGTHVSVSIALEAIELRVETDARAVIHASDR